jgi:hypothetical protein
MDDLIERLAAHMHDIWSNWFKHQHEIEPLANEYAEMDGYENMEAPIEMAQAYNDVTRWKKQAGKPYDGLSEEDKEKDRVIAREILALLEPPEVEYGCRTCPDFGRGYDRKRDEAIPVCQHNMERFEEMKVLEPPYERCENYSGPGNISCRSCEKFKPRCTMGFAKYPGTKETFLKLAHPCPCSGDHYKEREKND